VVNTKKKTTGGFVDFPRDKLIIRATRVIKPVPISIMPKAVIGQSCFSLICQMPKEDAYAVNRCTW
jgi:hypothetical protein